MSEHWLSIEKHGTAEIASALLVALHGLRAPGYARAVAMPLSAACLAEPPVGIEFVGLSPDEQRKALVSFPGGARFVLQAVTQPAA
ncbi:MAG: hypothetical protein JWN11_2075 [Hyphomicrobiales bacterium]|nr:hypothetical protein [Hyphomicrobiales bacterium]